MSFDTVDLWYREALSSCTKFGKVSQRQARAGSQESRRAGKLAAQRSVHMPPRQVPGASGGPRPQHHASKRDGKSKRNRRTRNRARGTARDHAKLLSSLQPMKAYVCAFQDQTGGWYGTSSAGRADMQVHEGLVGLLTKTPQQRRADDVERAARITRIKRQYTQPADAFRGLMKERKALIQRLLGDASEEMAGGWSTGTPSGLGRQNSRLRAACGPVRAARAVSCSGLWLPGHIFMDGNERWHHAGD